MPIPPRLDRSHIHVGTSGYYFEDWVGTFYPPKKSELSEKDRFIFYQRYFSFLEINATFYKEPELGFFLDLERRSRPDLLLAIKAHQGISHTKTWNPQEGRALMEKHVLAVSPIVETGRFFSFLIQLEDHKERSQGVLDYIRTVAEPAIERRMDVHVEFRHASWHRQEILQALKDASIGICNTEIPPVQHAFPLKSYATTPKGYVRYSGRNLGSWYPKKKAETTKEKTAARNARYDYLYSEKEVQDRAEGQMKLMEKTDSLAIAYNNHFQAQAIMNAFRNLEILKERLKIKHMEGGK
jgi:uncharacterized protein YecE (DUF72 family)